MGNLKDGTKAHTTLILIVGNNYGTVKGHPLQS